MNKMIAAIVDDDASAVKRLLKADVRGKSVADCVQSAWIREVLAGTAAE